MKLANLFFLIMIGNCTSFFGQEENSKSQRIHIEDKNGHLILDSKNQKEFLKISEEEKKKEFQVLKKTALNLQATSQAVEMCTNGGFEQSETVNGSSFLKHFLYTIGDPPGPTQCKSITNSADSSISSYDPSNTNTMVTSVPANLIDPFMGDIKAFDQYAIKINYENSSTYGAIVQGKRFTKCL
jgi:hypothetical protein